MNKGKLKIAIDHLAKAQKILTEIYNDEPSDPPRKPLEYDTETEKGIDAIIDDMMNDYNGGGN